MSFMQDEVIYETFLVGETNEGTTSLHPDVWSERRHYKLITGERWKKQPGWYARKSAPGYMDATDWMGPFDTEREALDELRELYDGDPIEDDCTEIRDEMELIRAKIGALMDRLGDLGAATDSEEENQKLGAIQMALGDAHRLILDATPLQPVKYNLTVIEQPNSPKISQMDQAMGIHRWKRGTIGRYSFEAKVFEQPSQYGIHDGNISKLTLWITVTGEEIVLYDREWIRLPILDDTGDLREAIDQLVAHYATQKEGGEA